MGDLVNHYDPLKKFGRFETSNQWILYDERFSKFFEFFTTNITEINILSENESLEFDEQKNLHDCDEQQQKQELEEYIPGLMQCNEIDLWSNRISTIAHAEEQYAELLELARKSKTEAHTRFGELEDGNNVLETQEKEVMNQCHCQAKELESLQSENKNLCKEAKSCLTKVLSPPLLFNQLPLEQYFTKCESFLQYFTLYIQENYKFQEFLNFDNEERETEERNLNMKSLKTLIAEFSLKYLKSKAKAKTTQSMMEGMDIKNVHSVNLNDLERELHDLELLTEHHLKVAHETLQSDLNALMQQHSQQRIELVLYENTKHKLERALRRLENDERLTKITSDALSNAELVWIAIQLDLERTSNRIDNVKQLTVDSKACRRRIKSMQILSHNNLNSNNANGFLEILADLLMKSSSNIQRLRSDAKSCLHEYEKFCRVLAYSLQNMLSGRAYITSMDQLKKINLLETMLEPLIYDSPIEAPVLYNVNLLRPINDAKFNLNHIENSLRQLRSQFQKNIVEKMENDPLWRASQMLWIWFLKQPKRLLMAMEEVKRASSAQNLTGVKNLSGIKRK